MIKNNQIKGNIMSITLVLSVLLTVNYLMIKRQS